MNIPASIKIDVTDLDIGDSVHIDEIPIEDNVEIIADVNFTVVTVLSPKAAEADEEAEEGAENEEGEEGEKNEESE